MMCFSKSNSMNDDAVILQENSENFELVTQ